MSGGENDDSDDNLIYIPIERQMCRNNSGQNKKNIHLGIAVELVCRVLGWGNPNPIREGYRI